jgi:Cof subfamily protein (haloacid dehalogenase superfamily)
MDKKIVFFDVDGTISTEDTFTIPESTKVAMKKSRENGHLLFINTGRTYCSIEKQIRELDVDGFICGCGTNIFYHGEEVFHHEIDDELRRKIVDLSIATDVENVLEGKEGTWYPHNLRDPQNINFRNRYKSQGFPVYEYDKGDYVPFDKMALWYYPESDIDTFKNAFKNDLEFIQRADNFIENIPLGYSKATGIKKIIDMLDIPWENTISIGDSTNDLAMLEYTKESIAMGNSNPVIFDHVTFKTTDINDDGVYNALKHFELF